MPGGVPCRTRRDTRGKRGCDKANLAQVRRSRAQARLSCDAGARSCGAVGWAGSGRAAGGLRAGLFAGEALAAAAFVAGEALFGSFSLLDG